jgi:hypothetical protein
MPRDPSDSWPHDKPGVVKSASTPDEMMALIEDAFDRLPETQLTFDDSGTARPPWEEFPDYERYSIGWRMGSGEDYMSEFLDWLGGLAPEENAQYRATYPEPDPWSGFYEQTASGVAARK